MSTENSRRKARILKALEVVDETAAGAPIMEELIEKAWPEPPAVPVYDFYWPFKPTDDDYRAAYPDKDRGRYVHAQVFTADPEDDPADRCMLRWKVTLYIWNPSMGYYAEDHQDGVTHGLPSARRCVLGGLYISTAYSGLDPGAIIDAPDQWGAYLDTRNSPDE